MIFRTKKELDETKNEDYLSYYSKNSWSKDKDYDFGWSQRYDHESKIILKICKKRKVKKILELGSGPGRLSQKIIDGGITDYTLVDLADAHKLFEKREYEGKFVVKDMENFFDITGLDKDYDLIIMNDFLEHIRNPSHIIHQCHKILSPDGAIFCSIPNWRTGHGFYYRGLFDFDNFIYFLFYHQFIPIHTFPSNLVVTKNEQNLVKFQTEEELPEGMLNCWNWYILSSKKQKKGAKNG